MTTSSLPSAAECARRLGGKLSPNGHTIRCSVPGRKRGDNSVTVTLDERAPDGLVVSDARGEIDDFELKDAIRTRLGIEPFKPKHLGGNSRIHINNGVREPILRDGRNGEGEVAQPRSHLLSLTAIDAFALLETEPPPRSWHVDPWMPGDDVTILGADGGEGKTTLALQLAFCTAWGFPWLGNAVRQGSSVYVTAEESPAEIHYRMAAINRVIALHGTPPYALKIISRADSDAVLAIPGQGGEMTPTPLFHQLVELVQGTGAKCLVLDASADVFGGNEIERSQVRSFIRLLRKVAINHECAVVLLAHPSVDGMKTGRGYSGSTHWNNSARCRLYLTTPKQGDCEPDTDLRELERSKSNRARRGVKLLLRWGDGAFTLQAGATGSVLDMAKAKRVFLDLLAIYTKQGRNLSDKQGPSYAPKLLASDPAAEGLTKDLLTRAMNELFAEGRLRVENYGRPSRPYTRLVEVEIGGAK